MAGVVRVEVLVYFACLQVAVLYKLPEHTKTCTLTEKQVVINRMFAAKVAGSGRDHALLGDFKKFFSEMDLDGNSRLSMGEFVQAMAGYGFSLQDSRTLFRNFSIAGTDQDSSHISPANVMGVFQFFHERKEGKVENFTYTTKWRSLMEGLPDQGCPESYILFRKPQQSQENCPEQEKQTVINRMWAAKVAGTGREYAILADFQKFFSEFDNSGTTKVTREQLIAGLGRYGFSSRDASALFDVFSKEGSNADPEHITAENVNAIFSTFDADGDGRVSKVEYDSKWKELMTPLPDHGCPQTFSMSKFAKTRKRRKLL